MEKPNKELSLRELRHKGMTIWTKMQDVYRDKRDGKEVPKEKETEFLAWDKDMNEVEAEIRFKEREELVNGSQARSGPPIGESGNDIDEKFDPNFRPTKAKVNETMRKYNQRERKVKYLSPEEKKIVALTGMEENSFERFLRKGFRFDKISAEDAAIITNHEARAQSTTTTAGGYTIPQGFIPKIIVYLKYISDFFTELEMPNESGTIDLFDVYRTESGNSLPVATNDDTSSIGELLTENSDASSSNGDFTFAQKTFLAYKYSSKMVKISNELLEDTGVDLVGYIAKQMGTRLGRILNNHFTVGTGSSQPSGITIGISQGKLAATTGTLTFPEIIALEHSVDPSYRKSPSARFMMHDTILAKIKQATVGTSTYNNRPLWAPGWDVKAPATIDGVQYLVNQDMASTIASGTKFMLYGDMKTFGVRWVNELRMVRLVERYAELDQVAYVAFMRADARLLNTSGIKYYAGT